VAIINKNSRGSGERFYHALVADVGLDHLTFPVPFADELLETPVPWAEPEGFAELVGLAGDELD
jgi:hypothetical protein